VQNVSVIPARRAQTPLAVLGAVAMTVFLIVHVWKDLSADVSAWYFHSTFAWLAVMLLATMIYLREMRGLRRRGVDGKALFSSLPPESS
jgi:hypothetical protein